MCRLYIYVAMLISVCMGQPPSNGLTVDQSLAVPALIRTREREFEAIVEFTPNYNQPNGLDQFPNRVVSYLIEWGPTNQNFPDIIRQVRPNGQMQVLVGSDGIRRGVPEDLAFRGRVCNIALSTNGRSLVRSNFLSFNFRSNSNAVNILRTRTNERFFDDFNGPPGDYDERRWNVAFDLCSLERTANFCINGQDHVHTQLGALNDECPAESLTARARGVMEIGTSIFFDIDGGDFPGHLAIVEIMAEKRDMPFFGLNFNNRMEGVRIILENSQLSIQQVLNNGQLVTPIPAVNLFQDGRNVYTIANIRRPWEIILTRTTIVVVINGVVVLSGSLFGALGFTQGHLYFSHENRNSGINGQHAVTQHLDNIGFDNGGGLLPDAREQFNYRNPSFKGFQNAAQGAAFTIFIPPNDVASFNGFNVNLLFTVQGQFDRWADSFSLNGRSLENIVPQGRAQANTLGINELATVSLSFGGQGILQTGNNFFAALPGNYFVGNVHIEFDVACGPPRQFTPPPSQPVFPLNSFPISFACDDELLARPTLFFNPNDIRFDFDGINLVARFPVDVETSRQLRHNGAGNGIDRIEVLERRGNTCVVIRRHPFPGSPFQITGYMLELTIPAVEGLIAEIWVRAVDTDTIGEGRSSTFHPTRFNPNLEGQGRTLDYLPLIVTVNFQFGVYSSSTTRVANLNEFDNNCSPDPVREQAFIGGNCAEVAQPTAGRVGAPICPPESDVIPLTIINRGERAPSRQELLPEFERSFNGGFTGVWDESSEDPCSGDPRNAQQCEDANAPPYDASAETNPDASNYTNPNASNYVAIVQFQEDIDARKNNSNVPAHWLDRDLTEGYPSFEDPELSDIVAAAILAAQAVPEEESSTGVNFGLVALIASLCLAVLCIGGVMYKKFRSASYREATISTGAYAKITDTSEA